MLAHQLPLTALQHLEHRMRAMIGLKRPKVRWQCAMCTFVNRSYLDDCEVCDFMRPTGMPVYCPKARKSQKVHPEPLAAAAESGSAN
jgi:hypothetical protein